MSKSTKITVDEWLKEAFPAVQQIPDNAFTIEDVMKITGFKRTTAANRIMEKIQKGEVQEIKCIRNGRASKCYVPIENKSKK